METKHYIDENGYYFGWQSPADPPDGSVEVSFPPNHARQKWNGIDYDPLELTWEELRMTAYETKGWKTPYDLIDDMLARGNTAVKVDRDAIKNKYPKI